MNIILQLHITGNCNLRCKHCYIEEHSCDMPYSSIKRVLWQYDVLIKQLEKHCNEKVFAHLHFTGGEPLLHPQIKRILKLFCRKRRKYSYAIMSNGSFLDDYIIKQLKKLNIKSYQLSLDGDEETHDSIRGKGNFKQVVSAMDLLKEKGLSTRVSFTANKMNYTEFPAVAEICCKHNVDSLWSDRFIPVKGACEVEALDEESLCEYVQILRKERLKYIDSHLDIQNFRGLQFIGSDDIPYSCMAGENLIVVDENGNIMPCRRMPVVCSDIYNSTLTDTYFNHPVFIALRKHTVSGKCKECKHSDKCKGGERCMSYAVCGDFCAPDPGCWLKEADAKL